MLRHIWIKMTKIKDRENMKSNKGKATNNIWRNPHKVISWFFSRNSAGKKGVAQYISNDEREKLQPRVLYPARLFLRFDREIKSFTDKQKLKEFITTKPALQ